MSGDFPDFDGFLNGQHGLADLPASPNLSPLARGDFAGLLGTQDGFNLPTDYPFHPPASMDASRGTPSPMPPSLNQDSDNALSYPGSASSSPAPVSANQDFANTALSYGGSASSSSAPVSVNQHGSSSPAVGSKRNRVAALGNGDQQQDDNSSPPDQKQADGSDLFAALGSGSQGFDQNPMPLDNEDQQPVDYSSILDQNPMPLDNGDGIGDLLVRANDPVPPVPANDLDDQYVPLGDVAPVVPGDDVQIQLNRAELKEAADYKGVDDIPEDAKNSAPDDNKYNVPIGFTRAVARALVTTAHECGLWSEEKAQPSPTLAQWLVNNNNNPASARRLHTLEFQRATLYLFCQSYRLAVNLAKARLDATPKAELNREIKGSTNPYTWCRRQIKRLDEAIANYCKAQSARVFKPKAAEAIPQAVVFIIMASGDAAIPTYFGGRIPFYRALVRALCYYTPYDETLNRIAREPVIRSIFTTSFEHTNRVLEQVSDAAAVTELLDKNGKYYLDPLKNPKRSSLTHLMGTRLRRLYNSKRELCTNLTDYYSDIQPLNIVNNNPDNDIVAETIRYYYFYYEQLLSLNDDTPATEKQRIWGRGVHVLVESHMALNKAVQAADEDARICNQAFRKKWKKPIKTDAELTQLRNRSDQLVQQEQHARQARQAAEESKDPNAITAADALLQLAHDAWMTFINNEFQEASAIYNQVWQHRNYLPSPFRLWQPKLKGEDITRNKNNPNKRHRGASALAAPQPPGNQSHHKHSSLFSDSDSDSDTSSSSSSSSDHWLSDLDNEDKDDEDSLARDLDDLLSI